MSPSINWSGAFLPGPYEDSGHIGRSIVRSDLIMSAETLYLHCVSEKSLRHEKHTTYGLLSWFGVPVRRLVGFIFTW
jgi:hypothetical protein